LRENISENFSKEKNSEKLFERKYIGKLFERKNFEKSFYKSFSKRLFPNESENFLMQKILGKVFKKSRENIF
jgi:hypothetical protein